MKKMDKNKIIENIDSCLDCKTCMEYCDTFKASNDVLKSPSGRLKIAKKIFINKDKDKPIIKKIIPIYKP